MFFFELCVRWKTQRELHSKTWNEVYQEVSSGNSVAPADINATSRKAKTPIWREKTWWALDTVYATNEQSDLESAGALLAELGDFLSIFYAANSILSFKSAYIVTH